MTLNLNLFLFYFISIAIHMGLYLYGLIFFEWFYYDTNILMSFMEPYVFSVQKYITQHVKLVYGTNRQVVE